MKNGIGAFRLYCLYFSSLNRHGEDNVRIVVT